MAASKVRKRIRLVLLTFWVMAFGGMFYGMQARVIDPSVFESDGEVEVHTSRETIRFVPVGDTTSTGLLFYPGALVDPEAYAPMARKVAEAGYKVVVVKVPFRMDILERYWDVVLARTEAVIAQDSSRTAWVVGGHSRGGKMATRLAREHPQRLQGLLLVGTSHPREDDLSQLAVDVVKIYGSEDGLASEEEVEAFAHNLPEHTRWVRVEGGNHTQFGWYRWQLGDGRAGIDRVRQQEITVGAIVEQLGRLEQEHVLPSR